MRTASPWNLRLREAAKAFRFTYAVSLYLRMLRVGASPDAFTFPSLLKSCAALVLPFTGLQIHSSSLKLGCLLDPFVHTSMITCYCRCGMIDHARKVFDECNIILKLKISYNALISGLSHNAMASDATRLFGEMMESSIAIDEVTVLGLSPVLNIPGNPSLGTCVHSLCMKLGLDWFPSVANSFLTMYMKNGIIPYARKLFDEMPQRRLISWNAMINGYSQNGMAHEALQLYHKMKASSINPDATTLVGAISSCASLGAQSFSSELEHEAKAYKGNPFITTALINMYNRCGNLAKAREIFEGREAETLTSWTAMISAYGAHGEGEIAVKVFDEMISRGVQPDETVFVCALTACSHCGLVWEALKLVEMMERGYKMEVKAEHLSCLVDALGRAGKVEQGLEVIGRMKEKADGAVWGALLNACRMHGNVEIAEMAFDRAVEIDPGNEGYYALLGTVYRENGDDDGVERLGLLMRERNVCKEMGCSY